MKQNLQVLPNIARIA